MEIYNRNKKPPKWALKTIEAGRLRGKTDINPQWRIEALTETFGLCGFGWKYEITKLWNESGSNNEILSFATINLYVKNANGDYWSESIPGLGGSTMTANESKGLRNSDECFKMAITDALSVACKMIGIGADIYAGKWDGSKYNETEQKTDKKVITEIPEITPKFKYNKWNGEFLTIDGKNAIIYDKTTYYLSDKAYHQLTDFVNQEAEKIIKEQQNQSDLDFIDNLGK